MRVRSFSDLLNIPHFISSGINFAANFLIYND